MSRRQERITALIGGVLLLVAGTGCPIIVPTQLEGVLQGTWELTGDLVNPDVSNFLITFDKHGQITRIIFVANNTTSVTIDSSDVLVSSSDVRDHNVSITATWGGSSTFFFDGTLNDDLTIAVGSTGYRLAVSESITIELPTGPATLTRQ